MPVDIDKLRQSIRQNLGTEQLLMLLDRAIELIEAEQLPQLLKGILAIDSFQVDDITAQSLLEVVEGFRDDSLAGMYYEAFNVNSRNFMEQSRGTLNWIAEFKRLLNHSLQQCQNGEYVQTQQAFKILLELLNEIDTGSDTIIFFADEGGSWQVGVSWEEVLPTYFTALTHVAKPKLYAQEVIQVVAAHVNYERDRYLETALKLAKPAQRKALAALMG
jgi:hypothetical protein